MIKYRYEYRINKKGAECFRTEDQELLFKKLAELKAKKPNVAYTTQSRSCRLDRYGMRSEWGIWS